MPNRAAGRVDDTMPEAGKRRLDFATVGSISAIMVAIASLFVAWDEARSVRRQQASAVLPIVKIQTRFVNDADERSVLVLVENVGVGPAFIDEGAIRWDGDALASIEHLRGRVSEAVPGAEFWTAPLEGQVLGGGDGFDLFEASWPTGAEGAADATLTAIRLVQDNLTVEACYCSVYDRCWRTEMNRLGRPAPAKRCDAGRP